MRSLLLLVLAPAASAQVALPPGQPDTAPPFRVSRPRDPWVFRCVLDRKPRMVTVALSDEMWIAYDATTCGIYKAWKGGVNFDGPVYTTAHGPQPTSMGRSYTEGFAGDVWAANVAGADVPAKVHWRGYVFNGEHVALRYEIVLPNGHVISVQESLEFVRPEDVFPPERQEELVLSPGSPGLLRSFLAHDIPEDTKVTVKLRTDAVAKLAEGLERESFADVVDEKGETRTQVISHLFLTRRKSTSNLLLFFRELSADAAPEQEGKGDGK